MHAQCHYTRQYLLSCILEAVTKQKVLRLTHAVIPCLGHGRLTACYMHNVLGQHLGKVQNRLLALIHPQTANGLGALTEVPAAYNVCVPKKYGRVMVAICEMLITIKYPLLVIIVEGSSMEDLVMQPNPQAISADGFLKS